MPFRNRAVVQGAGNQQAEQFVSSLTRAGKSFEQVRFKRHTIPTSVYQLTRYRFSNCRWTRATSPI